MIVAGLRYFGPVDAIETADGAHVGEVRTRFVHVWFIPILPVGSTFVTRQDGNTVHGVPVGLSFRSVLKAWGRAFCFLAGFGLLAGGFAAASGMGRAIEFVRANGVAALAQRWQMAAETFGLPGCMVCSALGMALTWILLGRVFRKASGCRREALLDKVGITLAPDNPWEAQGEHDI